MLFLTYLGMKIKKKIYI